MPLVHLQWQSFASQVPCTVALVKALAMWGFHLNRMQDHACSCEPRTCIMRSRVLGETSLMLRYACTSDTCAIQTHLISRLVPV